MNTVLAQGNTLDAMAESALETVPQISQDNPNEILVSIDDPYGYIEAHIRHKS
jgi:hypothetical protein